MSGYGDVAAVDGYYPQGYYHHGTPFMHHLHHQTQGTVTILTRLTKLETKNSDVPLIKKQKLYQKFVTGLYQEPNKCQITLYLETRRIITGGIPSLFFIYSNGIRNF